MVRVSKLTDYATLIMTQIAKGKDQVSSAATIARHLQLSLPTVSKILKILAQASLVTSSRGTLGGYVLSKSADAISLADIITAVEGQFAITQCCETNQQCRIQTHCANTQKWKSVNHIIYSTLATIPLSSMF